MSDLRPTSHLLGGLVGVFFILIFGGMYLIHLSSVQTQNFINQQAIARADRPAPTDAQLLPVDLSALTAAPAPTGSDPVSIPVVTAPDGQTLVPSSGMDALQSAMAPSASVPEPQLPWLAAHVQVIHDFFKPPKPEAVATTPTTADVDAQFDHPPTPLPPSESDDNGGNNEEQELTWKNPPSKQVVAGDLLEMTAPGMTTIHGVEVAGVITEGHHSDWLLKAGGADYDNLQEVIKHRPKHLKVVVQN